MEQILPLIANMYLDMFYWLCGLFLGCTILEVISPCNPGQPRFRTGIITDVLYYFIMPFLGRIARLVFMAMGIYIIFYGADTQHINSFIVSGYGPLAHLPLWLQIAMAFIITDIVLYWLHRWFHGPRMWRFHTIHHSSKHVDWLSTYRFHPINSWLQFSLADTLMLFLGFAPEAIGDLAVFNTLYSAMVHANLNWTFGPLRHIFSSPVFHRWHHTTQEEGLDKNFAPTFPLLDIIFGTFYMPDDKRPEHYGVNGSDIPNGFFRQMLWPFKRRR